MSRNFKISSRLGREAMMSRLGLEAMMSRLGLGRFGPRSSSEAYKEFEIYCRLQPACNFVQFVWSALLKSFPTPGLTPNWCSALGTFRAGAKGGQGA